MTLHIISIVQLHNSQWHHVCVLADSLMTFVLETASCERLCQHTLVHFYAMPESPGGLLYFDIVANAH